MEERLLCKPKDGGFAYSERLRQRFLSISTIIVGTVAQLEEQGIGKIPSDEGSSPFSFHHIAGTIVQMEEYNLAKVRVEGSIPSSSHPSSGG